jgi:hypothetical protein
VSKHSPLPWASRGGEIVAADGVVVARVDGPNRVDLIPTRDANRALLAAAPELLEALEAVLYSAESLLEELESHAGFRGEPTSFALARSAIAKAKGT